MDWILCKNIFTFTCVPSPLLFVCQSNGRGSIKCNVSFS